MKTAHVPIHRFLSFLFILLVFAGLSACGERPYDYAAPYLKTLSILPDETWTAAPSQQMVPTFTVVPSPSATPASTATPYQTPELASPSPLVGFTPLEGVADLVLENRTGRTLLVELEGRQVFGYEIAPAGVVHVQLPAGTYRFLLILPAQQHLRGSKIFFPGPSTWTFYRTPGVLDSPTPRWP